MASLSPRWVRRVKQGSGPVYLALAAALDEAIRAGELQPGERLPPQRALAAELGIDFTTVTRAYDVARSRGLVEAMVGRGTFVRAQAASDDAGLIDLSMNLPPPPFGISLAAMLRETADEVLQHTDAATLMAYHPGAGSTGQKAAGAIWLAPCLGDVAPERVLVCAGAQTAITAALASVCQPGDTVLTESLTYPGLKAAAAQLGLRLVACASDAEGMMPEAMERACREARAAAVYLVPTMQNPKATTMGLARRREIARTAEASGVWVIEDDPYSRLCEAPLPAIASFAPQRIFYVATLSKTLTPGLRVAYAVPPAAMAERLEEALRAVALMPAPLMTAVATTWIREGAAERLLTGVRQEARARRAMAAAALPAAVGSDEGLHVWLPLPAGWSADRLRLMARDRGLSLVAADAFQVGAAREHGVRISLGGPAKRSVLEKALAGIAAMLAGAPTPRGLVV
ncbi:MAG TPA: PLP-dependent aminotransferase family protein [Caulobacteraceae bacterium]|nr:PLP-dependent aminotransferase family protein [Caulobacteraceae bacterium]